MEKLFNGEIDCLVSDHSPCPPEMKAGNIMKAWGGIAGLQSCMDVMFDEAVQKRGMSLPMFGKLMATNAADIFGLQQKGRIAQEKMPTSSSFSRIAAMFLPMTIGISPQSQPVCWPYHWRAYHENHLTW